MPVQKASKTKKMSTRSKKQSSDSVSRNTMPSSQDDDKAPPTKKAKYGDDSTYLPDDDELSDDCDSREARRGRRKRGGRGRGGRGPSTKRTPKDTKSPYFSNNDNEGQESTVTPSRRGGRGRGTKSPYFNGKENKEDPSTALDGEFTFFRKKRKGPHQNSGDVVDLSVPSSEDSKSSDVTSGCGSDKRCGSMSSSNDEVISISSGDSVDHLYGMYRIAGNIGECFNLANWRS